MTDATSSYCIASQASVSKLIIQMPEIDEISKSSSGEMISCPSNSSIPSEESKLETLTERRDSSKKMVTRTRNHSEKIDRFLSLYCKWASSSLLTERGIKMLQWTMWLISQLTKDKYKTLSPSVRKIYSDLSMMRYVLRLYGMPTAIEAIRSGSWGAGSWKDTRIKQLGNVMAWSMAVYYPLEHVAWAQWTMPKLIPTKVDGNKLSAWSCRFWMVYILAEMASAVLKNRELESQLRCIDKDVKGPNDEALYVIESQATIAKSIKMNKLQIVRDILFTGPCITWALDENCVFTPMTSFWGCLPMQSPSAAPSYVVAAS